MLAASVQAGWVVLLLGLFWVLGVVLVLVVLLVMGEKGKTPKAAGSATRGGVEVQVSAGSDGDWVLGPQGSRAWGWGRAVVREKWRRRRVKRCIFC